MTRIPEDAIYLLEGRYLANLATVNADGSPQVTPVWVGHDGDTILINTVRGRVKERNLARDPRVALSVIDPANLYRPLVVRGRVSAITETGADEHINSLSKRYLDQDVYPMRQPGEVRVKVLIEPERVSFGLG